MSTLTLKKKALLGTFWTIAGYGAGQVVRFGGNLILTRLLVPELFGQMALINIFIMGLQLFSDTGVGPSIIQNKRGEEPIFLNTAWTLQAMRGGGLWICSLIISWPIAAFYKNPEFVWIIPVAGLTTVVSGFESTSRFTLTRRLAVKELAIFELGSQASSLGIMIIWAWFSPTIWALVGGNIVSATIQMLWSHRLIPNYSNRFAWDKAVAKELFSFGRWIFMSTSITFLSAQSDRLTLGRLFSFEMLGVFNIASTLGQLPIVILGALNGKILFPAFSKFVDLPRNQFRSKILNNRKFILFPSALGLAILASFGDILISSLYPESFSEATWMMPILSLGIWPAMLSRTIESSLIALGKPQSMALANLSKFIFIIVAVPIGFYFKGVGGAIVAVALNDLTYYIIVNYGLCREGLNPLIQDFAATGILIGSIAIFLFCRTFIGLDLPVDVLL